MRCARVSVCVRADAAAHRRVIASGHDRSMCPMMGVDMLCRGGRAMYSSYSGCDER